jgi:hypothetical protein
MYESVYGLSPSSVSSVELSRAAAQRSAQLQAVAERRQERRAQRSERHGGRRSAVAPSAA